jgi:uncharacterized membrane protein
MSRPRLIPAKESLDVVLILLAWLGPILIAILLWRYYGQLPERIPDHFNAQGEVNSMGDADMLLALGVLSLCMVIFLQVLNRSPHLFNYPVKITEENAIRQYRNAQRVVRVLNLIVSLTFAYLTYRIIQIALGEATAIGWWLLPLLLVTILLVAVAYWRRARALQ